MLVFLVKWEIYKVARLTLPFKLLEGFNENDVAEENLKINDAHPMQNICKGPDVENHLFKI